MVIVIGIILLILATGLIVGIYALQQEDESTTPIAVMGALCFGLILGGFSLIDEYCNPSITPMDVYRGKTTLEITYRDSVAIDSVVVLKDK